MSGWPFDRKLVTVRAVIRPLLVLLVVLTAACGGSDDDARGSPATITISNFEFAPETLQVKVGDTVTVDNQDATEHTVTATDGSFDTGSFTGRTTFTVTRAGRFEYRCEIHPFMPHRVVQVSG